MIMQVVVWTCLHPPHFWNSSPGYHFRLLRGSLLLAQRVLICKPRAVACLPKEGRSLTDLLVWQFPYSLDQNVCHLEKHLASYIRVINVAIMCVQQTL